MVVKFGVDVLRIEPIPQTAQAVARTVENTSLGVRDVIRSFDVWMEIALERMSMHGLNTILLVLVSIECAMFLFYAATFQVFYRFVCGLGIALHPLRELLNDVVASLNPEWVSLAMHACWIVLFLGFLVLAVPER